MPFVRDHLVFALALAVLAGSACKIRRLPELPPERDPVSERAPVTTYTPPPDVLTEELSSGVSDDAADPHAGHRHHGHAPKAEPAPPPADAEDHGTHDEHEGHESAGGER